MAKKKDKVDLELYNKDQQWWAIIQENCTATIKQFEDSIKLQKAIKELAISKIKELA